MCSLISDLWLNGQRGNVLTDDVRPEVELRCNVAPDWVELSLTKGQQSVYCSGRMPYAGPFYSLGTELEPKSEYELTVQAEKNGKTETAQMRLRTGFMGGDWAARWIEPEQEDAVPEQPIAFWENFIPRPVPEPEEDGGRLRCGRTLRRVFRISRHPDRAVLYATAQGVYTLYLNGQRVGNARLAPEITPYDQMLYYQSYDLAPHLMQGENELIVELGDGWYIGHVGLSGSSCNYGNRMAFLAQLELFYPDGTKEVLGTDETFLSRPSRIAYSDLMIGEKWDLCQLEAPWTPCRSIRNPEARLVAQPMAPIQPLAPHPGKFLEEDGGGLLFDFGQNLAGVVRLSFRVEQAATVILEHTEALDKEGHFFRNIAGRNRQQRDQIVCGPGEYCFEPLHTYHGFRYIRIFGLRRAEVLRIDAVPWTTPVEETGHFRCSDRRLNQLEHNIRWSMRSNILSIPTDCPQREKAGWTGDVVAFADAGCFRSELLPVLSAWLQQMRLEQRQNGEVPNIIPDFPIEDHMAREYWGDNSSSAWGDACILVPLALYRATGNVRVLKENLGMMERWLDFVQRAAQSEGDPMLWNGGHHFGDWLIPSMAGDPQRVDEGVARTYEVTANAYRAIVLDAWIQVLDVLLEEHPTQDLETKRDEAQQLLARVRQAVRDHYVAEDGTVHGELQGLYVTVLRAGIVEGELRKKVADRLVDLIRKNDCRLDTGFVSTPYLLDVLTEIGHKDLAWKLLFQTKAPSWLYQVECGATTIWENWTAVQNDGTPTESSMNHYALGAVGDWISREIGGVQCAGAGWSRVRFAPDPACGLDWSECEKKSAAGRIFCRWERQADKVMVTLETPVPAQWCWDGETTQLAPGKYEFTADLPTSCSAPPACAG